MLLCLHYVLQTTFLLLYPGLVGSVKDRVKQMKQVESNLERNKVNIYIEYELQKQLNNHFYGSASALSCFTNFMSLKLNKINNELHTLPFI